MVVALGGVLASARTAGAVDARAQAASPQLRLAAVVLLDIVRSNIAVARDRAAAAREPAQRAGFLEIPLELRHPARPGRARLHHHRDARHVVGGLRLALAAC